MELFRVTYSYSYRYSVTKVFETNSLKELHKMLDVKDSPAKIENISTIQLSEHIPYEYIAGLSDYDYDIFLQVVEYYRGKK